MDSKISIIGSGPVGIQAVVYLLEQHIGEIVMFDTNTDYVQGMVLDCMQASAVRAWKSSFRAANRIDDLSNASLLIVTENNAKALDEHWVEAAKNARCVIYASTIETGIDDAVKAGVSKEKIIGIQGLVDSRMLAREVSTALNISIDDVHAMVYGGTGKNLQSKPDFVRVHGIPVDLIQPNTYMPALKKVQALSYRQDPWAYHYTFAAAAVELALFMLSGLSSVIPLTTAGHTIPAFVGECRIKKECPELI